MFLGACQTVHEEEEPTASVAGNLLGAGVTSVVAMSHSVLVDTARRFAQARHAELARGALVGSTMLAGQLALGRFLNTEWYSVMRGPAATSE